MSSVSEALNASLDLVAFTGNLTSVARHVEVLNRHFVTKELSIRCHFSDG
jgi:hypothetical protein